MTVLLSKYFDRRLNKAREWFSLASSPIFWKKFIHYSDFVEKVSTIAGSSVASALCHGSNHLCECVVREKKSNHTQVGQ